AIALLLLRTLTGMVLLFEGVSYGREPTLALPGLCTALVLVGSGVCLMLGVLTPLAGAIASVVLLALAASVLPVRTSTLFDQRIILVLVEAILAAILLLGPGALSIDARLFGRREIIIPSAFPPSDG
ncbi:MAG TPA: hypothetical protein VE621_23440, partial [Bryobacteraceae bacterium]|nr:hypothetical protein [Bryobacteraceae bacterium]